MSRPYLTRRLWTIATTVALLVTGAALPAGSLAASTRNLQFGSPGAGPFQLALTQANPGGRTSYLLRLTNLGPSTLTHVNVTGGLETPDPAANPLFVPAGLCQTGSTGVSCIPSLPAGAHYLAAYVSAGSGGQLACSLTNPVAGSQPAAFDGLRCPVGNMAAGTSVQVRIIAVVPVATTPQRFWNAVQLNEGSSNTGANQDAFFTVGEVTPAPADCSTGGASQYFLNGETVDLSNPANCPQFARISGANFTDGAFLRVGVDPASNVCAPGINSCFGGLFSVQLVPGVPISGTTGVTWRIRWTWGPDLKKTNPKGFIHFRDGYPADPSAYDLIPFRNQSLCSAIPTNCWTPVASGPSFYEVLVVTPENGNGRGY